MAIESAGISSKFHFDLSTRYSNTSSTASSVRTNANEVDSYQGEERKYTRANAINLLERTLTDSLGKRLDFDSGGRFESPVRSITKNILSSVRNELREARNGGASERDLQVIINQASEGIQKGFSQAKDILQSRFNETPQLERQIERAFDRVQRGLERIDNRFAPNIDNLSESGNLETKQSSIRPEVNAAVVSTQQEELDQAIQVEFAKTRNVNRERSFELSIQTQDGDTINLSIEKSVSKQVEKQAIINEEGFSVSYSKNVQRDKQVSYEVSGDINQQEQTAIDALLKKVNRLADKFFDGNFAGAFRKATRIGIDTGQLASFSLNLQSSKVVEVTKSYREVQGIQTAQDAKSPVESLGDFVYGVADVANEDVVSNVLANPVPVATELFKQVAVRDERYAELVFEQSVEVVDEAIEGIADLAEQQLAQAA